MYFIITGVAHLIFIVNGIFYNLYLFYEGHSSLISVPISRNPGNSSLDNHIDKLLTMLEQTLPTATETSSPCVISNSKGRKLITLIKPTLY